MDHEPYTTLKKAALMISLISYTACQSNPVPGGAMGSENQYSEWPERTRKYRICLIARKTSLDSCLDSALDSQSILPAGTAFSGVSPMQRGYPRGFIRQATFLVNTASYSVYVAVYVSVPALKLRPLLSAAVLRTGSNSGSYAGPPSLKGICAVPPLCVFRLGS